METVEGGETHQKCNFLQIGILLVDEIVKYYQI